MFPIVAKSNGRDEYQPFTLGDIQALSELLPGIQEGGGVWLTSLYNKTRGKTLAMGDLRAILGFSVSDWALKELEAAAGTVQVSDRSPLNPYATSFGNAIRQKYPIPAGKLHSLVFKIKNGESGRTFIERAKTEWAGATGVNPDKESQQPLFRIALLKHAPEGVKRKMQENPDMAGAKSSRWETHFCHHQDAETKEEEEENESLKEMVAQLTKLQLADARTRATDKKKGGKEKDTQMAQIVTPAPAPPQNPYPLQGPPQAMYQPQYHVPYQAAPYQQPPYHGGRNRGRGRGGGRGRGYAQPKGGSCYICESPDHWARDCPQKQQQQMRGPPQQSYQPTIQTPPNQQLAPMQAYSGYSAQGPPPGPYTPGMFP
ncbi:uncharacterized protein LOC141774483 [Sebastes fasciatus]|uniref:uncharacterized protein LOC141774483 n=1 Tax=Sebastes fasciatus TaxID=394691 RepID=UPI003D9DF3D0